MTVIISDIFTSISTSYSYHGVISEKGEWRLARFAGGFFTPDPVITRPVNPGSGKAATRPGMLPDTLTTAGMTYFDDGHATLDTYDGLGRHMATKRYTMETQVFGDRLTGG